MFPDSHFECDAEFLKLMTRRADVDLTAAALELARDAHPRLDFRQTFDWLDDRVRELSGPVARAKTETEALQHLSHCLAEVHGIFGDRCCYERPDSSYLNRVIETRRGIPISLSVLYMAVAERLGLELKGVCAPMHFLTRYESLDGVLFIDAFSHGRILTYRECTDWLRSLCHAPPSHLERALQPATPRDIVIRMLNNLKALYVQQENWGAAWKVQHRLAALKPSSYQERRDLALISLQSNHPGPAIDLLQSCLRTCPSHDKDVLEGHLAEASRQLARWN